MKRSFGAVFVVLLSSGLAAPLAFADTFTNQLLFETQDPQSQWGGGDAFVFDDERFFGTQWDETLNQQLIPPTTIIPGINGFCAGVIVSGACVGIPVPDINPLQIPGIHANAGINGAAGITSDLEIGGGTVDVQIPVDVSFTVPDNPVMKGGIANIGTGFGVDPAANFVTDAPFFGYELGVVFDIGAGANIAGLQILPNFNASLGDLVGTQIFMDPPFNYNQSSIPNPSGPGNLVGFSLLDLARGENILDNLEVPLLPGVPQGNALNILTNTPGIDDISINNPEIQVFDDFSDGMLMGMGDDNVFSIRIDIDDIASATVPVIPPLEFDFDSTDFVSVPGFIGDFLQFLNPIPGTDLSDLELSIFANLIDLDFVLDLIMKQTFMLSDVELPGQLLLETGDIIDFVMGDDIDIVVPNGNIGDTLDIQVTLGLEALFKNQSDLTFVASCEIGLLGFLLDLPFGVPEVGFPPINPGCASFPLPAIPIADEQFDLGGFNQFVFNISLPVVPEPSVLLLMGTGVVGLGILGRRRRPRS